MTFGSSSATASASSNGAQVPCQIGWIKGDDQPVVQPVGPLSFVAEKNWTAWADVPTESKQGPKAGECPKCERLGDLCGEHATKKAVEQIGRMQEANRKICEIGACIHKEHQKVDPNQDTKPKYPGHWCRKCSEAYGCCQCSPKVPEHEDTDA